MLRGRLLEHHGWCRRSLRGGLIGVGGVRSEGGLLLWRLMR